MANTIHMESIVEIDENERYWVGKGFGKGLLPNDRGAFTTTDGSLFWKSTSEASEDLLLLGRGWVYSKKTDDDQDFVPTRQDQPEECWMYAIDFRPDHIHQAKPNQGALHFVRFRRLVSTKVFHPEEFVSKDVYEKCDHCDSVVTDGLSNLFLDVLAYTSLLHNKSHATDAALLPLKKSIIDLAISHDIPIRKQGLPVDAKHKLDILRKDLMFFVEKERSKTAMSRLLSRLDFAFAERNDRKEFQERSDAVAARCLSRSECDAIAGLIVRKLDPDFQLHCNRVACGQECQYFRVACPNEGCPATMSRIYLQSHDSKCPHKIVHCECGEIFKAHEMQAHRSEACKFRIVDCPFKSVGCINEVKACELQVHVTDDMSSHLLLAVRRIEEQQKVIIQLHSSVGTLKSEKEELVRSIQGHNENSTVKFGELQTQMTKLSKDLGDFEKSSKKEFKKLNSARQSLK
jgi:hypothetical protein